MREALSPDRLNQISSEETMALLLAIRGQGIMERSLLNAFEATPRRMFLNAGQVHGGLSPESSAPISCGQVQTAPTTIARVARALAIEPGDSVLEIGTGSGYQSAIIARFCRKLHTVDRFRTLIDECHVRFQGLRLTNILAELGDGEQGVDGNDVFDRIVVNAAVKSVPRRLFEQLKLGGTLVAPLIDGQGAVNLVVHAKKQGGIEQHLLGPARYLPIIPGIAQRL